ncbi:MAG: Smr/MutS family protein [Acetobacter sp.]
MAPGRKRARQQAGRAGAVVQIGASSASVCGDPSGSPAGNVADNLAGHSLSTLSGDPAGETMADYMGDAVLGTGAEPPFPGRVPVAAPVRIIRTATAAQAIGRRQPGVDDYSWRRFSDGGMRVELRLDLHGMVAQDAFRRLMEFMDVATRRDVRCVEIITGLGTGQEGGILRRELPHWLERPEIRGRILGLSYPHVGNRGSVRVLLRRRKG